MAAPKGSCGKGGNPATSSGAVWPGSSQQKITADEHGTYLETAPRQYVLLSNSPAEAAASPKGKGKQHAKGKSKVPRGPASSGEAAEKGKGALDQKGSGLKGKGKRAKKWASAIAPITTEGVKGKSPAGKSSKGFGKSGKPGKCASHEPSVPEHAVSKTESVDGAAAALTPPPRPPATPQAKGGRSNPTPEAPPSERDPAKGDGKGLGKGETGPPPNKGQ